MRRFVRVLRVTLLALLAVLLVASVVHRMRSRAHPIQVAAAPPDAQHPGDGGVDAPIARAVAPGAGARPPHAPAMTHGDSRRTHRTGAKGPIAPKLLWQAQLGGAVQGQIVASPDEKTLYAATLAGDLVALDREGKERFRVPLGDRAYGAPCVDAAGTIYVGSDAKRFVAVHADGRVAFRLEVDDEADTPCAVGDDGLVYMAAGRTLYAVRPQGDIAWRFAAKGKIFTAPALGGGGLVVVGSQDDSVYGVRAGKVVFATNLGADVDGAATLGDDDSIFVGTDAGEVVKLDAHGVIQWRRATFGFVRGPLSLAANGDVFAGVYGPTPAQLRLEPSGGAIVGRFPVPGTGSTEFGVHGGLLEDGTGAVYFGAQDDGIYGIAPDGSLRFRFATGGDVDAPLTILTDGALVAGSDDGFVYYFLP